MSHNAIESWICPPASVSNLQTLNLAQNLLTAVPPWLCSGKAVRLISVDLSLNPVFSQESKISKTVHRSDLKELCLSHCLLSQRDLQFVGQFPNLTRLELSNFLPKVVTKYDNIVRDIDLSMLQFRTNLIELLIHDVTLPDLPEDIHELVSLEVLDCRNNSLFMLPESLCKMPRLRVCLLSNNDLCVLPDRIGELTSLTELRLDRNNVS